MAKRFNMVSELFPPLTANMANVGAGGVNTQSNSNPNRPTVQTNGASNLSRSRSNSDEFNPVYFNHNMSIRLNDHNFLLWKQQVLAAIRGNRLQMFIQDRAPPPQFLNDTDQASNNFNPAFLEWEVQDQLLVSWLLSSMTESLLTRMVGCNTARQIWSALEKHFTLQVSSKILEFRTKLQKLRKGSLSLNDYLLKVKQHVDLLASVGEVLSSRDHIAAIFKGLPPEYDTFIISTNTRIEEYSVAEIEALLLASESQIEKTDFDQENDLSVNLTTIDIDQFAEANIAYQNGQNCTSRFSNTNRIPPSGLTRGNGRGFPNRGTTTGGNYPISSPYLNTNGRGMSGYSRGGRFTTSSNRVQCQLCHKLGHTVLDCFYRFDKSFTGVFPPTNAPNAQANIAATTTVDDSNWYPDSGASNHCTLNVQNLNISTEYEGADQLYDGDGLGYSLNHKGYKCLDSSGRLYISRDVIFDETSFPFTTIPKLSTDSYSYAEFATSVLIPLTSTFSNSCMHNVPDYTNNSVPHVASTDVPTQEQVASASNPPEPFQDTSLVTSAPSQTHHSSASLPVPISIPHIASPPAIVHESVTVTAPEPASTVAPEPASITTPATVSAVTQPAIPTNTHAMQTRGKSGIHKPKVYLTTKIPRNVKEALQQEQ
uniref:Retroviral polymerase SH3-like domain-containing protein n=1 Tax=Cannabis sativa TaxID=3483 RepID=A0A803P354_CANSA